MTFIGTPVVCKGSKLALREGQELEVPELEGKFVHPHTFTVHQVTWNDPPQAKPDSLAASIELECEQGRKFKFQVGGALLQRWKLDPGPFFDLVMAEVA